MFKNVIREPIVSGVSKVYSPKISPGSVRRMPVAEAVEEAEAAHVTVDDNS